MKTMLIVLAITFGGSGVAFAGETTQRYSIVRSGDGFVLTDSNTGQTSACGEESGQLICRLVANEREAYETDIAALSKKVDSLEKRIAALEKGNSPNVTLNAPVEDEKEFQTSLNRMEQFFRRFMGIVKEFQAFGNQTAPAPDRT
jgi:hypothetical protein